MATKHDLAALKKLLQSRALDPRTGWKELESMDTAELKKLAATVAAESGLKAFADSKSLLDAATAELYIRDGEEALRWAQELGGDGRRLVWQSMIQGMSKLSPMAAKPWIEAYHKEFGKSGRGNEFLASLLNGAAGRSAEDYLAVLEAFPKERSEGFLDYAAFADDFNFRKLFDPHCMTNTPDVLLPYLAAKDKEAAWKLVEVGLPEGYKDARAQFLGFAMHGVAEMEGEAAGLRWAMDKIDGVPEEQRTRLIGCLDDYYPISKEGVSQLMGWMRSDDERAMFARDKLFPGGSQELALGMLAYLPKDRQIDLLIGGAASFSPNMRNGRDEQVQKYQRHFDEMADKVGFGPEDKERMNKALNPDRP